MKILIFKIGLWTHTIIAGMNGQEVITEAESIKEASEAAYVVVAECTERTKRTFDYAPITLCAHVVSKTTDK